MLVKSQIPLAALLGSILLSSCAFPAEKQLGASLRAGATSQAVANGSASFENSAYEMHRSMDAFHGASPRSEPIQPSLQVINSANRPGG